MDFSERVILPGPKTGLEIYEAASAAASALDLGDLVVKTSINRHRYEPGSVKQVMDRFTIRISTKIKKVFRGGFLWLQKQEREYLGNPAVCFDAGDSVYFETDQAYKEFRIRLVGPWVDSNYVPGYHRRLTEDEQFALRSALRRFLEVFYAKLAAVPES